MSTVKIIYWSGTGNTEMMAQAIAEGVLESGCDVSLENVNQVSIDALKSFDCIALGCPSMGAEVLEESAMEPFVQSFIQSGASGKKIALFGSYDWGDGQWMRDWEERMENAGALLIEKGLIVNNTPDEADKENCKILGSHLAKA